MLKQFYLSVVLVVLSLPVNAGTLLEVNDAWIPEAPPVAKMHAGYLVIKNQSNKPVVLVAAQSTDYASVEMHKTVTKDGMARMIKQNEITIPAGDKLVFERGGLHLMLMHPKRQLKRDDKVEIKLMTKDNKAVSFSASVKAASLGDHDHSHHHHH